MHRSSQFIAAMAFAAVVLSAATPVVHAQFGNQPPRPPSNVGPPGQDSDAEEVPDIPQGRILPAPIRPPGAAMPPPGSVQTQPLPPPGAGSQGSQPPATANAPAPLPGLPPGQRQPKGPPGGPAAAIQPGDEIVTAPPAQKVVNKQAVFAGLDKITGRIIKFDVDMAETVQFGALRVKPQACYTRPATEAANTDAFVEVDEITLQGEVKRIFSGWMFAASPGLSGVEHPIYDVWLTDCKGPEATVASAEPPPPLRAPPAQQKKQSQPSRRQPAPPPQPEQPLQPLPGFR
ncbi:DUF2155 domain-containing protein [Bradyrhizobium sp. LHD-71]|uniref:DUF2155 domain-containing protein n=1 Tax=Bradyrhizobium sp. LHD-71 TaxID=3072141 RepID=UPI0035BE4CA1